MQPEPSPRTDADLLAILDEQKPGMYTHRCGTKDFMIPSLPGPGVARWCAACRVGDEDWTRDPEPARVYALPDPPVSLVVPLRDSEGRVWRYDADRARWCLPSGAWIDNWHRMVIRFGPLTEVTDDHA